jgi:predicted AAA+ superfamily ATPase
MKYIKRHADGQLQKALDTFGAVLVDGPKFCGKTETAKQFAKTIWKLDVDENVSEYMGTNPFMLLKGETPVLLDEWQEHPSIWQFVRREVDERKKNGQFILTGSAVPRDNEKLHSGAGRVKRIRMSPLTLSELGISNNSISFESLLKSQKKLKNIESDATIEGLAETMIRGGYPYIANRNLKVAMEYMKEYVNTLCTVDIQTFSGKKRDPLKIEWLIRSYARNISTLATIKTLSEDTKMYGAQVKREAIENYLFALERLMIIDEIPAWGAHIRSTITYRKAKKRHLVDSSIAAASLSLDKEKLLKEIKYMGFLFENLVIQNLKVYADLIGAKVFHYRDENDNEVDLIVSMPNGSYSLFEIKLGFRQVEEAVTSLKKFCEVIDGEKPTSLNIITGTGFSHTRKDGIKVIPIGCLRP